MARLLSLALGALLLGAATTATAQSQLVADGHNTVRVVGSSDGFSAPSTHGPGPVTFEVSTADPQGIRLGLVRLREGHQLEEFLKHLRKALTAHGAVAAAAGRGVEETAMMLGGAVTHPGRTATFRSTLSRGTYYLIDYRRVKPTGSITAHPLTIEGPADTGKTLQRPAATVTMIDTTAGPRFVAPSVLAAGTTLLFRNRTDQLAEGILVPVRPGTTAADIQHAFEIIDSGGWPQDSPLVGPPQGVPVLSSGQHQLAKLSLPPGLYALTTWVVDLDNGRMQAARGMHTLVTVR